MEENKTEKKKARMSLVTLVLIFLVGIMGITIIYLCVGFANVKVEDEKAMADLKANLKSEQEINQKLQGTIMDLQGKIDDIDETINGATKPTTDNKTEESTELTNAEKEAIEEFINERENMAFFYATYSKPEECITSTTDIYNHEDKNPIVLRYSIHGSKYTGSLKGTDLEKSECDGFAISLSDLQKFLKDRLNYEYSEEELKENFHYDESSGKVTYVVSDALFEQTHYGISNVEKSNGKYTFTVNRCNKNVKVTLTKSNGNYYFYSCEEE